MQIVLVRHGSRRDDQLTAHGEHQAERLATALERRGVRPTLFLHSNRTHAIRMCEILAARLADDGTTIAHAGPLDPDPGNPEGVDHLHALLEAAGHDLGGHACVLLVGHEGRLSNLVVQLTGTRSRPVPRGGAVCVEGADSKDLLMGRGDIGFRYPVVDHQEDVLRPKVQSKMTVATFLAGFVSAALVAALFVEDFNTSRQVASVSLTVALVLFVATIYVYDELGMPEGFWLGGRRRGLRRRIEHWREQRAERAWDAAAREPAKTGLGEWIPDARQRTRALADERVAQAERDGPVYTWMVTTWRWLFTPAVVLSLVGFGVLVADAGSTATEAACGVGVAVVLLLLAIRRPPLGTD